MKLHKPHSLLGKVDEICIVTPQLERTASGLIRLGITPWKIMEINPQNTTEQFYRGVSTPFSIRVAFSNVGGTIFELMQPLDANSIFAEHLFEKGEGLHHISFNMNNLPWEKRLLALNERGFRQVQSGKWRGGVRFAFFDTEVATGMSFETYHYPDDYRDTEHEIKWFPELPVLNK